MSGFGASQKPRTTRRIRAEATGPMQTEHTRKTYSLYFTWTTAFFVCGVSVAYADGATPLMSMGFFHLLVGNALIGCLEGAILARIFRTNYSRAIKIMIIANYVSMIVGYIFSFPLYDLLFERNPQIPPLYRVQMIIWEMWVVLFAATVVIEWPFCIWLLRGSKKILLKSILATLIAQVASYAILVPIYMSLSQLELYKNVKADSSLVASITEQGSIYFTSEDYRTICRVNLDGTGLKPILKRDKPDRRALEWRQAPDGRHWNLVTSDTSRRAARSGQPRAFVTLISGIDGRTTESAEWDEYRISADDLRGPGNHDWRVSIAKTPVDEGVMAYNGKTGNRISTFIHSPFTPWGTFHPTVLPGDKVVFELHGQIVLMDLNAHKIGFIAYGHSPAVILKQKGRS